MITLVDSQSWAPADFTGNSALVSVGTALYVVGGRREGVGHSIYRSTDHGATWEAVGLIPATTGTTDPAMVLGTDNVTLVIILGRPNATIPTLTDVVRYKFDTTTLILSAPLILVEGSKVATAYDVAALKDEQGADQGALVLLGAQEPAKPLGFAGKYALLAVEVAPDDAMTFTTLEQSHWSSGNTCGGVSLLVPPTGGIEAYYTRHPRTFTFRDTEVEIIRRVRSEANTWTVADTLTTYRGRFSDDKLTVVALTGNGRAVAQAYHTVSKLRGQQTHIILGVAEADQAGTSWAWRWSGIEADDYNSVKEPVIETDGTGIYLAYINCPWLSDTKVYAKAGFLRVTDVAADLKLTPRPGAWQGLRFKWLRGAKGTVDAVSKWAVVGIGGNDTQEAGGGPALYISQYNLPPHVVLAPAQVTLKRGIPVTLDASGTLDPDLDSLTYVWTHDCPDTTHVHLTPIDGGRKATLLVDRTIGPAEVTFTVTVTADDGQPGHQVSAASAITVPFNYAPIINLPASLAVFRNTSVEIAATVTDADADYLTYQWEQTQGTEIVLRGTNTPRVTARVYRVAAAGETLTLQLTVNDGVNDPEVRTINLLVSAIAPRDLDAGALVRAPYTVNAAPAKISQRNELTGVWAEAVGLGEASDFYRMSVVNLDAGEHRRMFVSPKSVLLLGGTTPLRRYPPSGERIWDAFHDLQDHTYLLTDQGRVLRYTTPGPAGISDWPDDATPIGDLVAGSYRGLWVEPIASGRRVIMVYGDSGVFLFQVMEDTFEVVDTLRVDMDSGTLPANRVSFIRTSGVYNLKVGQILVGVIDSTGSTVEVLVDLGQRRAVGTWDRSSLLSKVVYTGEILQAQGDVGLGRPAAPEWEEPELVGSGLYTLLWSQRRPDLITGYEVWLGLDAAPPTLFTTIPTGSIRRSAFPTQPGHTYHLTIRAQGSSAWSAFSSEQTIAT